MLDLRFVVDNPDKIKANCRDRNVADDVTAGVDSILTLETDRKRSLQAVEEIRRRQNEVAQATGKEKDPARRSELVEEGKRLKGEITRHEAALKAVEESLKPLLARLPNLTHPDAPIGATEDGSVELRKVGTPRTFDFKPKDHVVDRQGPRPDRLRGRRQGLRDRVLLPQERRGPPGPGLPAVRHAASSAPTGSLPIITPDLARVAILEGIGFNPRGAETQVYSVENTDLCLIGTAEITLGGMHADEIIRFRAIAPEICRPVALLPDRGRRGGPGEPGVVPGPPVHQGRDVRLQRGDGRGIRGDPPRDSSRIEEEIFTELGIPYRVLDICSGDLGGPAYRKFDLEAWMPGRGEAGEYGEVTSTSDCTDYQARRLNIRYKPHGAEGDPKFVHTLNGTAVALSRAMIVVLENYQRADGLIDVPEVLRPLMGKDVIGRATR